MTETLVGVSPPKDAVKKTVPPSQLELAAARELVKAARHRGAELTGPDGLLKALTKTELETALDEEMSEHLGYDSTPPRAATAATPATGSGPRRC